MVLLKPRPAWERVAIRIRVNDRETYLINNGIPGQAEILHREQTGTYINELPQVKFLLLITISNREPIR